MNDTEFEELLKLAEEGRKTRQGKLDMLCIYVGMKRDKISDDALDAMLKYFKELA